MKTIKNNILAILLITAVTLGVKAQDKNKDVVSIEEIPQDVMTTFNSAFPESSEMQWTRKDDNYKVTFTREGMQYHAMYNASGNLISQGQKVEVSTLPAEIINAATRDYPERSIAESHVIRKDDQTTYKIRLSGSPELKVIYSPDGTKLKDKADD